MKKVNRQNRKVDIRGVSKFSNIFVNEATTKRAQLQKNINRIAMIKDEIKVLEREKNNLFADNYVLMNKLDGKK